MQIHAISRVRRLRPRNLVIRSAALMCALIFLGQAPTPAAEGDNSVPAALRSIFSPRRAPAHRTMGLSQRSFLDLVEESKRKLEIALVIDGSDSMETALAGVREALSQMMGDLELYKQNEVAYQIVVYRDSGAPSGEVVFPLNDKRFTTDREAVLKAINDLSTETGAPYFPELVDQGVQKALAALEWSTGDDVTRWIFLFGDAPPFDASLNEESTRASRRVATDALVALADTKEVRINCVLCVARDEDRAAYDKVLNQTRAFMNALSSGTGGVMLDLSYDDIRSAMIEAAAIEEVEYSPVGLISGEEVEQLRAKLREQSEASGAPVSMIILPHTPLDQMTFASDAIGTQLATELRMRIKSIPGLTVVEPLLVERRFDRLRRNPNYSGLEGTALLQALGRALGANYVLWGEIESNQNSRKVTTRLYDTATGEVLTEAQRASSSSVSTDQLGSLLAGDLLATSIASAAHQPLAMHLAAIRDDASGRDVVTHQISTSATHDDLVTGLADLELALAYPTGDPTGRELLQRAKSNLESAAAADDTNALPHYLLANCLFNLAKQEQMSGGDSADLMKQFGREIRAAYRFRSSLPDRSMQTEIEADYALMVRKKPEEAVPLYQRLADAPGSAEVAKRANWMLAGIYGGDWGVEEKFVDRGKARECLIRILALWPDSTEAEFIKRILRWDEQTDETKFPQFPKENENLAAEVDREV